ncbi:MAG TPA: hypothetical protein PLI51_07110 [bacterium]|nr:hypothetical protein [bacterium]HPQ66477.1 hypothetical protein [bacterium]
MAACVFHHVPPPELPGVAAAVRSLLGAGGDLFVFEHNPLNPLTVRAVKACALDRGTRLIPRRRLAGLLRRAGLAPVAGGYFLFFPPGLAPPAAVARVLGRLPLGAQYYIRARRAPGAP